MRKKTFFLLFAAAVVSLSPAYSSAKTETSVLREAQIGKPVIDAAFSTDGRTAYFLTKGEVVIYALQTGNITGRFDVDPAFDKIGFVPAVNALMLAGQNSQKVQFIKVDSVFNIPVKDAPFKGPADAPVTVVVFADYQ